jgi:formylglycine-generating enzyme
MWASPRSTSIFGLAVLLASAGCQVVGDLDVKELSAPASPAPSPESSSSSNERAEPQPDISPKAVAPKPGCTENRPGARLDCGVAASRSCCETAKLPGGSAQFRTVPLDDDVAPRTAEVGAFEMDVFEVTVGRFRAFVEAGGGVQSGAPTGGAGAHPSRPESGWRDVYKGYLPRTRDELDQQLAVSRFATWSPEPETRETHPIAGVSWYLAMAFCIWDGGRLPTDAEWAYAAAGGDENRKYPWGAELVVDPANWQCGDKYGSPYNYADCTSMDLLPVGSRPKGRGRWGHEDLLGNVDEWMLDIYCSPPVAGTCKDCVTTGSCFQRTARGGDLRMFVDEATLAYSRWLQGNEPNTAKGFRCVRVAP